MTSYNEALDYQNITCDIGRSAETQQKEQVPECDQ